MPLMTSDEVKERKLQLEKNCQELGKMLTISDDVVISLLTEVTENASEEIAHITHKELSEAKAQLTRANEEVSPGEQEEDELLSRLARLESENEMLKKVNHRLKREQEEGMSEAKLLEEEREAILKKSDRLRKELDVSEKKLKPLLVRLTDLHLEWEEETPMKANHRL